MEKSIEMLAAAWDRFTAAYERRTEVERDRLHFEQQRDVRHAKDTAIRLEVERSKEARIAAKEARKAG